MANTTNFAVEKPTVGGYRNSWGGTINTGLDKLTELLALALPIGTIQMYPKATAPTATTNGGAWLVCNGASVLRTGSGGYADLFAMLGTTYGTADGTHFNLPDLRSRVPVGYNTDTISGRSTRAIAAGAGTETHQLLDAEIPKHTHPITDSGHIHATSETAHTHTGTVGSNTANVTIAPNPHVHTFDQIDTWTGADDGRGDIYAPEKDVSRDANVVTVTGTSLTATDSGHTHSVTGTDLGVTATALTIDTKVTGITVDDQGSGDGTHNIMQPYLVVNYIILAKHPTF